MGKKKSQSVYVGRGGEVDAARAAARAEFRSVSAEVYAFGRQCGTQSADYVARFGAGAHHFGTRASAVWAAMPNRDVDLNKARRRVRVPYPMLKRSLQKKAEAAAKLAAAAPPPEEDPLRSAALLRKRQRLGDGTSASGVGSGSHSSSDNKKKGQSFAEWKRQRAGDRSGLRGIGTGARGVKATGVGRYDTATGVLHIRDFELSGVRRAQRVIAERKKGRSLGAAVAAASGAAAAAAPKAHRVGWRRKGQHNRRK